jgi:hypothetical protein
MARLWEQRVPGVKPAVLLTAGGPENIGLLMRHEADVAFSQSGIVYAAVTDGAKGAQIRATLRGLTHLYPNVMHLVVRKDSGVTNPADLKGKRFIPGPLDSAAYINSTELLSLYGLTLADVKAQYMGYAEAAVAVRDGLADGALIPGGLYIEAVSSMLNAGQADLLPLDAPRIMKKYPWYYPYTVPAGTYPNQAGEVRTVAVANILMARADLPDDLAYNLVKSLYEGKAELQQSHPAADLHIEDALRGITGVLELHPGAARYMREAGVLP